MEGYIEELERTGVPVKRGVSGASITTFGSGGQVDCLISPREVAEVISALELLTDRGIPYRLIGGGSNLLLPDDGYGGALISLARLSRVEITGERIVADAGCKMPFLAGELAKAGLSGLEYACGIPGTIGGAVMTNAGAFGQSLSDVLVAVVTLSPRGRIETLPAERLKMCYHGAALSEDQIILSAICDLEKADPDTIEMRMDEMRRRRVATQPRERSAGSVFRRVGETPAAIYIERTGLKGLRIGGATLSTVHCNFIVNVGGATTADYFAVAERIRERVLEQSGVTLSYEVERICSQRRN